MITIQDIQGLIALAIQNNKIGLINAMNATGNNVPLNISDDDLLQKTWDVFNKNGLDALKNVLTKVTLDKSKLTAAQQNVLIQRFSLPMSRSNCDFTHPLNCITAPLNYIGDLIGGHSTTVVTPGTSNTTSQSPISPTTIIFVTIIGIIAVLILAFK